VTQESLLSYEAGAKLEMFDRKISINAAAFYYDYKDKQLRTKFIDPIFGALDKLENVPKSRIMGAEFEATARPADGLTLSVSTTYLDATVRDYIGVVGQNLLPSGLREAVLASFKGERLPFAPKFSYAARFDYEMPASDTLNFFVGAGINGQSKIYSSLAATPQAKSDYIIKGYALVNATAGVKSSDDRWRFSVWGKNIFNKFYLSNRFESYDTYVQTTGRPAEYGATVSLRY